jgi:ubiquinone/menaquinone biosynthesis C-methylase UbiE
MADKYRQTIAVYKKLGKEYLNNIAGLRVKGIEEFIKLLPRGGNVLDIGCAGGRDAKIFVSRGLNVTGIDLVDAFLKTARRYVPGAKFIKMDLRRLKFPKNSFDAIWANAVLVHIYKQDLLQVLKGFYRVLKPRGKLHIRMKKGRGARAVAEKLSLYEKRIFVYVSKAELERLVKKADFKILQSKLFPDELGRKGVKWIGIHAEKI